MGVEVLKITNISLQDDKKFINEEIEKIIEDIVAMDINDRLSTITLAFNDLHQIIYGGTNQKVANFLTVCQGLKDTNSTNPAMDSAQSSPSSVDPSQKEESSIQATTVEPSPSLTDSVSSSEIPSESTVSEILPSMSAAPEGTDQIPGQAPWLRVTAFDQCEPAFRGLRDRLNNTWLITYGQINLERALLVKLKTYFSTSENSEKYSHTHSEIDIAVQWLEYFEDYLHSLTTIVNEDLTEGFTAFEDLVSRFDEDFELPSYLVVDLYTLSDSVREELKKPVTDIDKAQTIIEEIKGTIDRWRNYCLDLVYLSADDVMLRSYMAGNMTKKALAEKFLSYTSTKDRGDFWRTFDPMEETLTKYREQVQQVCFQSDCLTLRSWVEVRHSGDR